MAFRIKRVGHLVLKVKDLERSRKFFTEILGFPQVGQNDHGMLFFSTDVVDNHHMLALREAKEGAPMPNPEQIGMEHVSFEVATFAELQEVYQKFKENNVKLRQTVGCATNLWVARTNRVHERPGIPLLSECVLSIQVMLRKRGGDANSYPQICRTPQTVFHGIAKSVYFYDPDGNMLEVYCNVPPEEYRKSVSNPYYIYGNIEDELEGKIPQRPGTVAP